jgi:hypothetical protein
MPSSDFCLIPRRVAIQIPVISNQHHAAAGGLVGSGARRLRAHPRWGGRRGGLGLPLSTTPKKSEGVDLSRRRTIGAAPKTQRLVRKMITS